MKVLHGIWGPNSYILPQIFKSRISKRIKISQFAKVTHLNNDHLGKKQKQKQKQNKISGSMYWTSIDRQLQSQNVFIKTTHVYRRNVWFADEIAALVRLILFLRQSVPIQYFKFFFFFLSNWSQ